MQKDLDEEKHHSPVLLNEALRIFDFNKKKQLRIIDATLGLGGHALEFVKRGAEVLGIDADEEMLKLARFRLEAACSIPEGGKNNLQGSFKLVLGNFRNILQIAEDSGFNKADGILMDLGVSSPQITSPLRGISFQNDDAPLDMRVDKENLRVKGSDLLNLLRKDQLVQIFRATLNYKDSMKLAEKIIQTRNVNTVKDFKQIIDWVLRKKGKIRVYTLPFLALRIAVNSELENLKEGFNGAVEVLGQNGKLAVISFHSGEDRIVKAFFRQKEGENQGFLAHRELVVPTDEEINLNKRARSAKMRVLVKNA